MSAAGSDLADDPPPRVSGVLAKLIRAARAFIADHREGAVVAWALGGFGALWMVYDTISFWPVDVRADASEASLWAQNFAFGYKHPPMTAWLFALWFAVFPRTDWAAHLQSEILVVITLAVTWRLLRDHLDKERALYGLLALFLVPFYSFRTSELNASTVMMPFWPAALLFYLRARRGLGRLDAVLAGAFAGLTLLGKYWAVYLLAGMAAASVLGPGTRRFWRSPAPYLMAAGAAVVVAPHVYWYAAHAGGSNAAFLRGSVMTRDSFGAALARSFAYLMGIVIIPAAPLALMAALRPGRAALADMARPSDEAGQRFFLLFAVPLVLPALVNLVLPHRLTSIWTTPNWALLPIVLYAARSLAINASAVAKAGLLVLAVSLGFLAAAPFVAYRKLLAGADPNRPDSDNVALLAGRLAAKPVQRYFGSLSITANLPFYLPNARPLTTDPLSSEGRSEIGATGLLIACLATDANCRSRQAALSDTAGSRSADVVFARTFLGLSGPQMTYRVTVVPAAADRPAGQP